MSSFQRLTSRILVLHEDNIDTDQIIPARYLVTTSRQGLGEGCFADWRYDGEGNLLPNSPLNALDIKDCKILIAGDNFGCGSSREHAPWALLEFGFQVVISTSFADIFKGNALKNGLVVITISPGELAQLMAENGKALSVDLERQTLSSNSLGEIRFQLEPFTRVCLLEGVDQMGYLLARQDQIDAFEAMRPDFAKRALFAESAV